MTISVEQQRVWIKEAERLHRIGQRFVVDMDVNAVLCLVGQVQLACRHPENKGMSRDEAERFVRQLQAHVESVSPVFAAMLEAGWHSEYDEVLKKPHKEPDRKDSP